MRGKENIKTVLKQNREYGTDLKVGDKNWVWFLRVPPEHMNVFMC